MGLLPDLLPGYVPVDGSGAFRRGIWQLRCPPQPGLDLVADVRCRWTRRAGALYVVGSNPVARYGIDPDALPTPSSSCRTCSSPRLPVLADVVFPAANLYEKSGTVTNTYGDLQLVKKAADRAGVRTDFELIVRLADRAGRRSAAAGSLRPRRARRFRPDPRRAIRRGRSSRRLACRQPPGDRSSAPSIPSRFSTRFSGWSRPTMIPGSICWPETTSMSKRRWSRSKLPLRQPALGAILFYPQATHYSRPAPSGATARCSSSVMESQTTEPAETAAD